jgi:hypothetical protein
MSRAVFGALHIPHLGFVKIGMKRGFLRTTEVNPRPPEVTLDA